jgi:protein-tyrosine phosphatase
MAAIVLRSALAEAGLTDQVEVTSAGTGPWWQGSPAHELTQRVLRQHGYLPEHVARQITKKDLPNIDLILAADSSHVVALRRMDRNSAERVVLFRSFDPAATDHDIPDPYGGPESEYVEVMKMVRAAVPGIVAEVQRRLQLS